MRNITDWINRELYPVLFNHIDQALPEFEFKRKGRNWISSNGRKITGEQGEVGKVHIWDQAPGVIKDFTRGSKSVIDQVMEQRGLSFIDALKHLATIAGLSVPRGDMDQEAYSKYKSRQEILEACSDYFIYCLGKSEGTGAVEVREYLHTRGYMDEDIEAMGLGYIPSQEKLLNRLKELKYTEKQIAEIGISSDTRIGSTHQLVIPYRAGGSLKGFKFRSTGSEKPKYINTRGLEKNTAFFNLSGVKGDRDLVIVEGELDSLHATAKGMENVVALAGSFVSPEQITGARLKGAKKFTICLDQEPEKAPETADRITRIINLILEQGTNRIYIAKLPDLEGGKVDPDSLIRERGINAFKTAIEQAQPYYRHLYSAIIDKYNRRIEEGGPLTDKELADLIEDIKETGSRIDSPIDRDLYIEEAEPEAMGIRRESFSMEIEAIRANRSREAKVASLKEITGKATRLVDQGEEQEAIQTLEKGLGEIKNKSGRDLLPPRLSFDNILEEISSIPPSYKTGYKTLDKVIGFTPGAITLVAGRPSHGKTTLLFNLLLGMADTYRNKTFYFFTYEEPARNISVKLLNRLVGEDLFKHYRDLDMAKKNNYEFIKQYIRAGRTDIPSIEIAKDKLRELIDRDRIRIIDKNYSVESLHSLLVSLNGKEQIGAVLIDYIQRMNTTRKTQDKRTEIAHISDQVLQIAKETGLPIILGAQLNREASDRPSLTNLKEAGNLEEDANTVISVYCPKREEEERERAESFTDVDLDITVLKNREGAVNVKTTLSWSRHTGVIKDKEQRGPATYK